MWGLKTGPEAAVGGSNSVVQNIVWVFDDLGWEGGVTAVQEMRW